MVDSINRETLLYYTGLACCFPLDPGACINKASQSMTAELGSGNQIPPVHIVIICKSDPRTYSEMHYEYGPSRLDSLESLHIQASLRSDQFNSSR